MPTASVLAERAGYDVCRLSATRSPSESRRVAGRAQERGGLSAAAAFLELSLTGRRAEHYRGLIVDIEQAVAKY